MPKWSRTLFYSTHFQLSTSLLWPRRDSNSLSSVACSRVVLLGSELVLLSPEFSAGKACFLYKPPLCLTRYNFRFLDVQIVRPVIWHLFVSHCSTIRHRDCSIWIPQLKYQVSEQLRGLNLLSNVRTISIAELTTPIDLSLLDFALKLAFIWVANGLICYWHFCTSFTLLLARCWLARSLLCLSVLIRSLGFASAL